jgi:hypothetical protein
LSRTTGWKECNSRRKATLKDLLFRKWKYLRILKDNELLFEEKKGFDGGPPIRQDIELRIDDKFIIYEYASDDGTHTFFAEEGRWKYLRKNSNIILKYTFPSESEVKLEILYFFQNYLLLRKNIGNKPYYIVLKK